MVLMVVVKMVEVLSQVVVMVVSGTLWVSEGEEGLLFPVVEGLFSPVVEGPFSSVVDELLSSEEDGLLPSEVDGTGADVVSGPPGVVAGEDWLGITEEPVLEGMGVVSG
jgi:hypothetical protein